MTTDIIVRGQARDVRDPDLAELTLVAQTEARDQATAHATVGSAVAALTASAAALQTANPGACDGLSASQAHQSSWTSKMGQRFTETVTATMRFTDFAVMSEWVFANTNAIVQLQHISWQLSRPVRDAVRRQLGMAAVADARDRAETFADAAGLTVIAVARLADPGLLFGSARINSDEIPLATRARFLGAAVTDDQGIDLTPDPIETTALVEAHFLAE